ncbi:hypothetical protein BT69DRAFT_1349759 [Atractiella rhizophila]|nr:hypothetical protein BT69DRAFT_1349759 [Atractiella rhizophila]
MAFIPPELIHRILEELFELYGHPNPSLPQRAQNNGLPSARVIVPLEQRRMAERKFIRLALICKAWIEPVRRIGFANVNIHVGPENSGYPSSLTFESACQRYEWLRHAIVTLSITTYSGDPVAFETLRRRLFSLERLRRVKIEGPYSAPVPLVDTSNCEIVPSHVLESLKGLTFPILHLDSGYFKTHQVFDLVNNGRNLKGLVLEDLFFEWTNDSEIIDFREGSESENLLIEDLTLRCSDREIFGTISWILGYIPSIKRLRLFGGLDFPRLPAYHFQALSHLEMCLKGKGTSSDCFTVLDLVSSCPNLHSLIVGGDRFDQLLFHALPSSLRALEARISCPWWDGKDRIGPSVIRECFIRRYEAERYLPALEHLALYVDVLVKGEDDDEVEGAEVDEGMEENWKNERGALVTELEECGRKWNVCFLEVVEKIGKRPAPRQSAREECRIS